MEEQLIISVFIAMSFLALLANLCILGIILKYKKLQSEVHYLYIFNIFLIDTIILLLLITLTVLISKADKFNNQYDIHINVLILLMDVLRVSRFICLMWMLIDWFLARFLSAILYNFRKFKVTIITSVYVHALCASTFLLVYEKFYWIALVELCIVCAIFLMVFIVSAVALLCKNSNKSGDQVFSDTFAFKVAAFNVCIWLPGAVCIFMQCALMYRLVYATYLTVHVATCSSIIQVFLFCIWDSNYKQCILKLFCVGSPAAVMQIPKRTAANNEKPIGYGILYKDELTT